MTFGGNKINYFFKFLYSHKKCHRVYLGDLIMILLLYNTVIERSMLLSTFHVVMLRKIKYGN